MAKSANTRPNEQNLAEAAILGAHSCIFPFIYNSRVQLCGSRSRQGAYLLGPFGGGIPRAIAITLNRLPLIPALWPRPLPSLWSRPLPSALRPIKKSRPGRCTPPRASVRRPRLAKESAAILFFSWFQWGEKEEAVSGAVGGDPPRLLPPPPPPRLCSWRGKGGVSPGRKPAAAPLREGRRWEGDGGYR